MTCTNKRVFARRLNWKRI